MPLFIRHGRRASHLSHVPLRHFCKTMEVVRTKHTPTCLLGHMLDAAHEILIQVSGHCSAVEPLRLQCQVPNIVVSEHCVPALQALVLCPLGQPIVVGNQVHCSFRDELLVLWHMEQASVCPSNVV